MSNDVMKYEVSGQEIVLSPDLIRKYLVNGDSKFVTDQEIQMFLQLCKYQGLNPWIREAYLIKYGERQPATIVTGKETFLKRAQRNPKYKGHTVGISDNGKVAWAEVYVDGYVVPIKCEVDFEEYVGRKADGTITKMWKEKPHTMLKKVALVQALREAFPEDFGGMYSPEEISNVQTELLPNNSITPEITDTTKTNKVDALKNKLKESLPAVEVTAEIVEPVVETTTEPLVDEKKLKTELYKALIKEKFTPKDIKLEALPKALADITYAEFKKVADRLRSKDVK